jgi:hypothetical protein
MRSAQNKMKRLKTALSLIGIAMGMILTFENAALADHSLANAMSDSETIAIAVEQIQSVRDIVCDTENSNQTYYYPSEQGEAGSAWKQIALCFEDEDAMMKAREYFVNGGELGFYGAPGIVGVLVVSYTWEDYQAGRLISIEYL